MKNKNDENTKLTRRDFLKASATMASAFAIPSIVPSSVFGATAPSNRITLGFIGMGGQGMQNMNGFLANSDVQVLAVCDVETGSNDYGSYYKGTDLGREPALKVAEQYYANNERSGLFKGIAAYVDYRDVISRSDIDAVVISTPDHWHVPMAIAAAKAGKDIYCEKPLTLTVSEGRHLCNVVKRYSRIFQTGSHHRCDANLRFACEIVRNGRIGKLHTIKTIIPPTNVENPIGWKPMPVPKTFDYDRWLGPAAVEPYHKLRCHYTFRFILDYAGGQMTNIGAHYLDMGQWGNGTDRTGPVEIAGKGEFPVDGLFDTATDVHVEYTYANGVKMYCDTGVGDSVRFEGTDGWISVHWEDTRACPGSLLHEKIGPNEIHLYRSKDHKRNFLDCVKLRKAPIADVETGHRSATLCHLGNIAMKLGRKLKWDPDKEQFIGDDQANRMLTRTMRVI